MVRENETDRPLGEQPPSLQGNSAKGRKKLSNPYWLHPAQNSRHIEFILSRKSRLPSQSHGCAIFIALKAMGAAGPLRGWAFNRYRQPFRNISLLSFPFGSDGRFLNSKFIATRLKQRSFFWLKKRRQKPMEIIKLGILVRRCWLTASAALS